MEDIMDRNELSAGTSLMVLDPIKREVRDHWNKASDGYNKGGYGPTMVWDTWKNEFRELIGDDRKKVLDVGTGTGFAASVFDELGHDVTGVDLSPVMLANARKNIAERHRTIRLQEADAENLPFDDNTFDLVVSRHVLWTLPNPEKAISEWIRVTKPGGKVAMVAGSHADRRNWITDLGRRLYLAKRSGNICALTNAYSKKLYQRIPYASRGISVDEMRALLEKFPVKDVRIKDLKHITELSRECDRVQKKTTWYVKHIYYPGFIASFTVPDKAVRPWDKPPE